MDVKEYAKRSRHSSSDTEDRVVQDRKRERASSGIEDQPLPSVFGVGEMSDATADVQAQLAAIAAGQKSMIDVINANFVRQSQSLAAMIDDRLASLRDELNGKLRAMQDEIQELRDRLIAVEARPASDPVADADAALIYRRLDTLERRAADGADATAPPSTRLSTR